MKKYIFILTVTTVMATLNASVPGASRTFEIDCDSPLAQPESVLKKKLEMAFLQDIDSWPPAQQLTRASALIEKIPAGHPILESRLYGENWYFGFEGRPLDIACKHADKNLVNILLEKNVAISYPKSFTCYIENDPFWKLFVTSQKAPFELCKEIAHLLIQHGADVNYFKGSRSLLEAISVWHIDYSLENEKRVAFLLKNGALLESNSDYFSSESTALHDAARLFPKKYLLISLLLHGKDITTVINRYNRNKETPLTLLVNYFPLQSNHAALKYRHHYVADNIRHDLSELGIHLKGIETTTSETIFPFLAKIAIRLFLKKGGDSNKKDGYHQTPLHIAIAEHSSQQKNPIAQALIDAGADVNLGDLNGNTALHLAVKRSSLDTIKALLKLPKKPAQLATANVYSK